MKMKYYIARANWGGEDDKSEEFIQIGIWCKGHEDDTFDAVINNIDVNDIIILAGLNQTILCIGKCSKNLYNGECIEVSWFPGFKPFTSNDSTIKSIRRTISKINKESFKKNVIVQAIQKNGLELENFLGIKETSHKKRIKTLIIENVKAFNEKKYLHFDSKNVLIYGENGSGKSSIATALKFLFQASFNHKNLPTDFRNIFKQKDEFKIQMIIENINSDNEDKENLESYILNNDVINGDAKLDDSILRYIHFVNPFLEFKDIMQIYFHDVLNESKQKKNLFPFFYNLLKSYPHKMKDTNNEIMRISDCELNQDIFTRIVTKITDLKEDSNEYLTDYFKEKISIENYEFDVYKRSIHMNIKYRDQSLNNYVNILNEARLSRLAISVYLLAIKDLYSIYTNELKILVLDDLLISLDMSHRLPVFNILEKEFSDTQIIFLTHDKGLYDIIKGRTTKKDWEYIELYENPNLNEDVESDIGPIIKDGLKNIDQAKRFLDTHDYECCGVFLRKTLEEICTNTLNEENKIDKNNQKLDLSKLLDKLAKQYKDKEEKISKIIMGVQNIRKEILNPAAHYDSYPLFKEELLNAYDKIKKLEQFLNDIA